MLLIELCLQSWTFPNTQLVLRDSQLWWLNWLSWKAEAVVVWVNIWLAKKWLLSQISVHEPTIGVGKNRGFSMDEMFERGRSSCILKTSSAVLFLWGLLSGFWWRSLVEVAPEVLPVAFPHSQDRSVSLSATSTPSCASKIVCHYIPFKIIGFSTLYGFGHF